MGQFHSVPWEQRSFIVDRFSDGRLRVLGKQLLYVERPDLLSGSDCFNHDQARARKILGSDGDVPWMTVSKALLQLDAILNECQAHEHALLHGHREYLSECYLYATSLIGASVA